MKVLFDRARRAMTVLALVTVLLGGLAPPAAARPASDGPEATRSTGLLSSLEVVVEVAWRFLRGLDFVAGFAGEYPGDAPPPASAAPQNDEGPGMGPDG